MAKTIKSWIKKACHIEAKKWKELGLFRSNASGAYGAAAKKECPIIFCRQSLHGNVYKIETHKVHRFLQHKKKAKNSLLK